jgi:serine/threonine-protein kinase
MPTPGDLLIDRYRILDRLGSGGTATVDRAHDERLDRDVAVKMLLPNLAGDPATAARFEREARSLAAASHQGVVAVFDVDAGDPATGREPFFVMELCPGGSLADRLAGGRRMTPDELVPILVPIADGLADLHRRGVVHRDIKPQNILFAADRAKLADFGLALADGGLGAASELTQTGMAVGTLPYLAPEILSGERATSAADVYGLGAVAFTALTGRPPRPASSIAAFVAASGIPSPPVSSVAPELGPAFDEAVAAALAVRPTDRPDALGLASALTTALGRWTRDGGPARRTAGLAAAAAMAADQVADEAGHGAGLVAAPLTSAQVAIGRLPAGDRSTADDATTAIAIGLGPTAAIPVADPAPERARRDPTREQTPGPVPWLRVATAIAVGLAILATIAVLSGLGGSSGLAGPSATSSRGPRSNPPSVAPSAGLSPSAAAPSPSVDPAVDALRGMEAAIAAARGGPDGLKGKEANDLEAQASDVQRALDRGDRTAALDAARKLDQRVADVSKGLADDRAAALRQASAALVRALGG